MVRQRQRGALMVGIMAALAIAMILSAVAVREWADIIRRDNEAEMMFRAQDLVRGLRRFQKDKGRLPNELKELTEAGSKGQYFVRRLWSDPLVKGGAWQLLYAGPQGGLLDPSLVPPGSGSGEGAESEGFRPFGSRLNSQSDDGQTESGSGLTSPIGAAKAGGENATGLPIAGVKSKCTDQPFRVYKQNTAYSEWVFSVFDLEPQQGAAPQAPNPAQRQPPRSLTPGAPAGNPPATFPPR